MPRPEVRGRRPAPTTFVRGDEEALLPPAPTRLCPAVPSGRDGGEGWGGLWQLQVKVPLPPHGGEREERFIPSTYNGTLPLFVTSFKISLAL
jgi:hypothetical protein